MEERREVVTVRGAFRRAMFENIPTLITLLLMCLAVAIVTRHYGEPATWFYAIGVITGFVLTWIRQFFEGLLGLGIGR